MPLFKKDFSMFSIKEKTIPRPPSVVVPESPHHPPPPPPPVQPRQPEAVYHSTLLLLDKHGLSQEPKGAWDDKMVMETPSSRNENSRIVFDPESRARPAQNRYRREIRERKAEREARSLEEGWLEGPAQHIAQVLEEIEDTRCEMREAGRWENIYLEVKTRRLANARNSWFGKEAEEEKKCRMAATAGLRSVRPPEWTLEFEAPTQLESSAASIKSQHRISTSSFMTIGSLAPTSENRQSILSMTTSGTTPRSSIMSMTQASSLSSPISSGMPSPTLSMTSGKHDSWKGASDSPTMEHPSPISLPPPAVTA